MIEQINHAAELWWDWTLAMFWQVGVLIALIALLDRLVRRWAWPQLRYALWLLILVKLVLSPGLSLPSGLAPKLRPFVAQAMDKAISEPEVVQKLPTTLPFFDDRITYATTQSEPHVILSAEDASVAGESVSGDRQAQAAGPRLNWQSYAMAVWFLGMVTLGAWLIAKLRRLSREYPDNSGRAPLPQSFYDQLAGCAKHLGLRRKPTPVVTSSIQTPAVFGLFRPVLLMPVGYIRNLSRKDTEYLLLHELAHIKRGDLVVHSVYMLLQLVYWYNPLLWLVRRRLRHLRELCCDATVAGLLRNRTAEYRRTLLEATRQFLVTPVEYGLGLVGLFEDSNCLISRINCLEKPVWRYRKMKKLVAITLALILLACVLPMAQAQQDSASESSNAGPAPTEPSSADVAEKSQAKQAQSQELEQLQRAMQALQIQLQQLELQKQKLEHEMQALSHAEHEARHARNPKEQTLITQAFLDSDLAKEVLPALSANAGIPIISDGTVDGLLTCKLESMPLDDALAIVLAGTPYFYKKMPDHYLVYSPTKEEKDKALKSFIKAREAKDKSEKAKAQAEQWQQWAKQMEHWAEHQKAWANSDDFKKWQKDIQEWAANMQQWAKEMAQMKVDMQENAAGPAPAPASGPMPVMPPMPPMPVNAVAPVAPALPVVAPPDVAPPGDLPVVSEPRMTTGTAPVLPGEKASTGESGRDIQVKKDKDGKYVATTQMQFVSKVKPNTPFIIRNNLGRIVLRPSKDGRCDVTAVIRGKAKTEDEARAKVEQVGMTVNSSEERYYLKPVTPDGNEWNNLNVDLFITMPSGVEPDIQTKMGNVELYDLEGKIKAVTNMGAIKAVNTTGDLELVTKMGSIEFIAPEDLSAKFSILTKMGSIKSDLPLEINQSDMFRKGAQGMVGDGQGNIRLTTDMGSINLKWYSPAQDSPVL